MMQALRHARQLNKGKEKMPEPDIPVRPEVGTPSSHPGGVHTAGGVMDGRVNTIMHESDAAPYFDDPIAEGITRTSI